MSTATFRSKNRSLVEAATSALEDEQPMTLRQLFYRLVSNGVLQNLPKEYKRLGNVTTRLREAGDLPRRWIVDHVRTTLKPSSWSGLADFGETVRHAYRKDFWAGLPCHVEVFVEKDAVAGTVQPVTNEYDVALRVVRGYASVSFAGEIADLWARIQKPIHAYYLGDFDPSGFDLERDLREKQTRYSGKREVPYYATDINPRGIVWERLGIIGDDFEDHNLLPLPVKAKDNRAKAFVSRYGSECAELDALPPSELRQRVEQAILGHIDRIAWHRLQEIERLEQETLDVVVGGLGKKTNPGSVSQDSGGEAGA